ncbi:MAG: sodium:solute symporter [Gemmatimonadetes bacterium]|nr:sodium:solute symporter [Gemmatimonadota bacterium]
MSSLDFGVMAAYFAIVLAIGAHFARRAGDANDYFLGRHHMPWVAVMFSIVATETSALTVISIPGIGARTNLTFLQVAIGYLVGRVGVSVWLLPGYFRGEQETAYHRLESRFGLLTRRVASAIFMTVRALGDSVRVFATAIPLTIVTGWSVLTSVLVVGIVTVAYTWAGGIRAVVWVDVMQLVLYTVGGVVAIIVAVRMAGGAGAAFTTAAEAGRFQTFDWTLSFSVPYTFASGLIGGALLSAASHGTDHLIVQRILTLGTLTNARKALVGSGVLVIMQFALFLIAGALIWAAGVDNGTMPSDEIFPRFIVGYLPAGLAGLVVAGILAAAMSTVSSSLNSLASATTHDFYAPLSGKKDPAHLLVVGRWATLAWAVVLMGGALLFQSEETPVVELALSIASITYGGLLGTYIMAGVMTRTRQRDAITAIVVATVAMVVIVLLKPPPFASLAWPWYVPLGTTITLVTAFISQRFGVRPSPA